MNYLKIYKNLIEKRLKEPSVQQYTQKHHILPRSISYQNNNNIVILSAREHFIAHALLVKITQKSNKKENYYKMVYAFQMMNKNANNQRYINSHLYQLMKYKYSQIRKQLIQEDSPTKGKIWITNLELEQNKLIYKDQQLSQGWLYGRVINFNNYKKKYEDALNDKQNFHFLHYEQDIKNNRLPIIKKISIIKPFLKIK